MGRIVRPVFGKPCDECGEQIAPARVRKNPTARRCIDCQTEIEMRNQRALQGARDDDIVIIRKS